MLASVDMYDIKMDSWWKPPIQVPALNQGRTYHASCCVGDFCYVGCGWSSSDRLHTLERINVAELLIWGSHGVAWEMLTIANHEMLSPRCNVSMSAINANQLILFGGHNDGGD